MSCSISTKAILASALFMSALWAQGPVGTLNGTITDPERPSCLGRPSSRQITRPA